MEKFLHHRMSRRAVLGAAAGLGLSALFLGDGDESHAAPSAPVTLADNAPKHIVWVWQFDVDGPPDQVLARLRDCGLGITLKTNEGHNWMSLVDNSPTAISGPDRVREMVTFFESAGVPFHAWCVVEGIDPVREAQICSEVLNAGARSMTFDLEPPEGGYYWQADRATALRFGEEMRRLQPHARLCVAPDSRPWQIDAVPLVEFATFCDEILPQSYWQTFNSPANVRYFSERGYHVGPEGVTPEIVLNATADKLRPLGRVIRPIGQGAANGPEWERFIRHAYSLGMDSVSVWRYGTASNDVWGTLKTLAPAPPAPVAAPEPPPAHPAPAAASEPPPAEADPTEEPPPSPTPEPSPTPSAKTPSERRPSDQQWTGGRWRRRPATSDPDSTPASEEMVDQSRQPEKEACSPTEKRVHPWTRLFSLRGRSGAYGSPAADAIQSALEDCSP